VARSLSEALPDTPLFFEPVPPTARTREERAEQRIAEVAKLVESVPRLDAIDVPELVDENHEGRPFYRTADPRAYARSLAERTDRALVVNKVVAYLDSGAAVERWARETVASGLRHLVLVGGTSRYIPYPGPPVAEANRLCHPILAGVGGLLGNITIPYREGEAHRMLSKTRAGAGFFTTQLVFDGGPAIAMLREYDALCRRAGIPPASVLLSFAPLADEQDTEFIRWLGAELPEEFELAIVEGTEAQGLARSRARAFEVWNAVVEAKRREDLSVPLGVNVEQISVRHFGAAGEMLRAFAERLPSAGASGATGT
jgi:5,10-methylenetetrahydrofolate reductase